MNIIACVDDNMGLLFNNRRQSTDARVTEKIYDIVSDHRFLISSFSETLFSAVPEIKDDFLEVAGKADFCFVENVSVSEYIDKIGKVYLFKWNRNYPYDFVFDIDLGKYYTLYSTEEFRGNSHEKITLEVWGR